MHNNQLTTCCFTCLFCFKVILVSLTSTVDKLLTASDCIIMEVSSEQCFTRPSLRRQGAYLLWIQTSYTSGTRWNQTLANLDITNGAFRTLITGIRIGTFDFRWTWCSNTNHRNKFTSLVCSTTTVVNITRGLTECLPSGSKHLT